MSAGARVLVTGATGQVGAALVAAAPSGWTVRGLSHAQLDIADERAVAACVAQFAPQVIINAAAYTAVDRAEADADAAMRINSGGPANLARAARSLGATRLIHISTDFVFDGRGSSPYRPDDAPAPLGVYGASKLAGEREVRAILPGALIVRTAWVYAARGHNFMRTMLRLMQEREQVNVVADQVGTPTAAPSLAHVLWQFAARSELSGVFHWTDAGVASWYDFAVAIGEEAGASGLLKRPARVNPITTADYPTPARRPAYSVLDKSATIAALALQPVHWRDRLRAVLKEVAVG